VIVGSPNDRFAPLEADVLIAARMDPSETLSLIVRDDEPTIANSWQKNERDDD
jgi:hypothetical protein